MRGRVGIIVWIVAVVAVVVVAGFVFVFGQTVALPFAALVAIGRRRRRRHGGYYLYMDTAVNLVCVCVVEGYSRTKLVVCELSLCIGSKRLLQAALQQRFGVYRKSGFLWY